MFPLPQNGNGINRSRITGRSRWVVLDFLPITPHWPFLKPVKIARERGPGGRGFFGFKIEKAAAEKPFCAGRAAGLQNFAPVPGMQVLFREANAARRPTPRGSARWSTGMSVSKMAAGFRHGPFSLRTCARNKFGRR